MKERSQQDLEYWYDTVEKHFPIRLRRDLCRVIQEGLRLIILLQSKQDKYVLRVLKQEDQNDKAKLINLLETLDHLHNSDIPIAYPYKWNNGSFIIEVKRNDVLYYCTLYKFVQGESTLPLTTIQQYEFGKVLASFHNAIQELNPTNFQIWDIDDTIQLVERYFGNKRKNIAQKLIEVKSKLIEIYDSLESEPTLGIVHGDLHNFNIHFHQDNPIIMDFDGLSQNFLAFDIAVFIGIERFLLTDRNYDDKFPDYQMLIEGYSSIRKLTSIELQLLPIFQIERFIFLFGFWISVLEEKGDKELEARLMKRIFFVLSLFDDLFYIWETDTNLFLDSNYMKSIYLKNNSIDLPNIPGE
jgi:Ser/Thr protein kinase RdoA (MazF antagonist)